MYILLCESDLGDTEVITASMHKGSVEAEKKIHDHLPHKKAFWTTIVDIPMDAVRHYRDDEDVVHGYAL